MGSYIAYALAGYDEWKTEPDREPYFDPDPEAEPWDFDERREADDD